MFNFTKLWQYGGTWLAAVRRYVQFKKFNGSTVIWGSDEELIPPTTIRQVEEIGRLAAVAGGNEILIKIRGLITSEVESLDKKNVLEAHSGSSYSGYRYGIEILEDLLKKIEELAK